MFETVVIGIEIAQWTSPTSILIWWINWWYHPLISGQKAQSSLTD